MLVAIAEFQRASRRARVKGELMDALLPNLRSALLGFLAGFAVLFRIDAPSGGVGMTRIYAVTNPNPHSIWERPDA